MIVKASNAIALARAEAGGTDERPAAKSGADKAPAAAKKVLRSISDLSFQMPGSLHSTTRHPSGSSKVTLLPRQYGLTGSTGRWPLDSKRFCTAASSS